ncbi:MAG: 50S ribosomal protein L18 [Methermicoccaceae archaeon]
MARNARYNVPMRRRREGRTDYRARLKILLSNKPRVVARYSNRMIQLQLAEYSPVGDKIVISCDSRTLKKLGYTGSLKSLPASYLTGLLFGYEALNKGYSEGVLDIGLHTSNPGSRLYAAVKGALDAGMDIPCSDDVLPDDERIRGEHIAAYRGIDVPSNFEVVKREIENRYSGSLEPESNEVAKEGAE